MIKKQWLIGMCLWAVLFAGIVSCSEQAIPEGYPEMGDNSGAVSEPVKLDVDAPLSGDKGSFILKIRTADEWKVSVKDTWCSFVRTSGKGNANLMGTVESNRGEARSTTITVVVGGKATALELSQAKQEGSVDPEPGPDPINPSEYAKGLEVPRLLGGDKHLFVTHTTQFNGKEQVTYSYEWDCSKKHSRWVAFTFSANTPDKNVGRNDDFKEDPKIPSQYRTTLDDYKNSGYSRGHLCASSDRQYSKEANRQTFYLSNMSPQIQNGFNGGIWMVLEDAVQSWGNIKNSKDVLYVAKGGTIGDGQIKEYIGVKKDVPVPKYYYMALLYWKGGKYQAIAFWLEHKDYGKDRNYAKYAISVDELEQKTGIDFFHNLPDDIENKVEAGFNKSDWGLS